MNLTIMPNFYVQTPLGAKAQQNTRISTPATSFGQNLTPEQVTLVKRIGSRIEKLFPKIITSGDLRVSLNERYLSEGNNFSLKALKPTPEDYLVKADLGPDCCGMRLEIRDKSKKGWEARIDTARGSNVAVVCKVDKDRESHNDGITIPENILTNALKALLG